MKGIAHLFPKAETKSDEVKTSGIKFNRSPVETKMPGLAETESEWEVVSGFFSADSPAELKYRLFEFIDLVRTGRVEIRKVE